MSTTFRRFNNTALICGGIKKRDKTISCRNRIKAFVMSWAAVSCIKAFCFTFTTPASYIHTGVSKPLAGTVHTAYLSRKTVFPRHYVGQIPSNPSVKPHFYKHYLCKTCSQSRMYVSPLFHNTDWFCQTSVHWHKALGKHLAKRDYVSMDANTVVEWSLLFITHCCPKIGCLSLTQELPNLAKSCGIQEPILAGRHFKP